MSNNISRLYAKEPNIGSAQIQPIKPSQHWQNRLCAYKYVLSCCPDATQLPASPRAELGTLVHKLLQWSSSRRATGVSLSDAEKKFDELLSKREAELAADPLTTSISNLRNSCDVFLRRRHAAITHAQHPPMPNRAISSAGKTKIHTEEGLKSPDGLVTGTMDAVYECGDDIQVVDKKTGDVTERGEIKESYKEQLYLYAGLIDECIGRMPSKLILIDGDNRRWDLQFSPEQIRSNYRAAKEWLETIKAEISEKPNDVTQLAEPRPENCRICQYRPACRPYWTASRLNAGGFPSDFSSRIASISTLPLATIVKFTGYDASLSFRVKASEVANHPMLAELKAGDKVIIANVNLVGRQMETTPQTVVYKDLRP